MTFTGVTPPPTDRDLTDTASEKQIETYFTARLRGLGCLCDKQGSRDFRGAKGDPDRLVIVPFLDGAAYYWVELKTRTGRLTPLQAKRHRVLDLMGCFVITVYGMKQAKFFIELIRIRHALD